MPVTIVVTDWTWTKRILTSDGEVSESIIDIGEEQWVDLPYSCRSGACFACSWTVIKGEEYINPQKTWDQLIDTDEWEVLCCIAWVKPQAYEDDATIEIEMLN